MTFHAILPGWLMIGILSLLTLLLLWIEWGRPYRFRSIRLLAVLIMMMMLAGILLRPVRTTEQSGAVLLTPGYSIKTVDSLIKTVPGLILKHTPGTAPYKESKLLRSYQDLGTVGNSLAYITGHGIPGYARDLIQDKNFSFIPSALPAGVTRLSIPSVVVVNHETSIDGIFNSTGGIHWLYLNGPGGKDDSLKVSQKGLTSFRLQFKPRQAGNLIYTVSAKDSSGINIQGDIPIDVQEEKPLNILFLQGYPTFETQYLKNFLAHKKHALTLRYQLSKNNFRYEYANRSSTDIPKLTKTSLAGLDVLIADQESLDKLTSSEKAMLTEAVRSGLGFLGMLNKEPKPTSGPSALFPFKIAKAKRDTTVVLAGLKAYTLSALPVRAVTDASLQSLMANKSGILTGFTFAGAGKVGFQFLQETYQLALSGDSLGYSSIWSPLLESLARARNESSLLQIVSPFPRYRDEPISLEIISGEKKPVLLADSVQVPLQENSKLDDIWQATVWADAPGWHTLQVNDDNTTSLYVSKKNEWNALSVANQQNMLMVAAKEKKNSMRVKTTQEKEVSMGWFFVLFVLSAGFIWLAPKL